MRAPIILSISIMALWMLMLLHFSCTDRFDYSYDVEVVYFNGDKEILYNLPFVETFNNGCLNGKYCGVRNYHILTKKKIK